MKEIKFIQSFELGSRMREACPAVFKTAQLLMLQVFFINQKNCNLYGIRLLFLFLMLFSSRTSDAQHDHPETLSWAIRMAEIVDRRLNDAAVVPEQANLLVKLMESYEDFEAVALAGFYCHEARQAAEQGRHYCNWLSGFTRDKDVNALIERAQNARVQANKMREAAVLCLNEAMHQQQQNGFMLADVLRSNAAAIEHDLSDGLASEDFHILAQKTEHAERIFQDTELLALRLQQCEKVRETAREGIRACSDSMAAPNWTQVKEHLQTAMRCATTIALHAGSCRY